MITKTKFIAAALAEYDKTQMTADDQLKIIEFWENQYDLFINNHSGPEIHDFTYLMLLH